jgi:hypothetical protein
MLDHMAQDNYIEAFTLSGKNLDPAQIYLQPPLFGGLDANRVNIDPAYFPPHISSQFQKLPAAEPHGQHS